MEDLALIVSLMLFVPIIVGLIAISLAIVWRLKGKFKKTAIGFSGLLGLMGGLGMATYPLLGVAPLTMLLAAVLLLFIPKS